CAFASAETRGGHMPDIVLTPEDLLVPRAGSGITINGSRNVASGSSATFTASGSDNIRMAVMGLTDRKPTRGEVREMQELLIEAMENGAFGMSSGLAYVPGAYTDTEDVAEIAKVMADYGGVYATHMRNESFDLIPSVKEAIEIGEKAGVSVHISHFKAMGRPNWGKVSPAIEEVEKARLRGLRVTADQYPYNCSMSALYPCVPPHYFAKGMEEALKSFTDPAVRASIKAEMDDPSTPYENFYLNSGGFSGVTICTADATKEAEGLTVEAYAKKRNMDPYDAFFDLLIENHGNVSADYHSIGEDDILSIAALPFVAIGTDGLVRSMDAKCHPRGWGTMVHAIMEFTRNHPIMSLEEVIRKMTSLPAEVYGIKDRGLIREGYRADLVVIDESRLNDRATYQEPNRVALGIPYVFVGGKIALKDGALTGVTNGVFLRKTGR
ncbi:MAG: amidohydrolase family protein, partial [Lachnospiraceae bacterium]|nr:amidohydrolase family protein [Lachnospiraceae bacterium]